MTDTYVLFALRVENLTLDELNWVTEKIQYADLPFEIMDNQDNPNQYDINEFTMEFKPGQDERSLLITDVEGHDGVEAVIAFLKDFLGRFRPSEAIGFQWACTCSRSLPDRFAGGAAVVTALHHIEINTPDWLASNLASVKQSLSGKPANEENKKP